MEAIELVTNGINGSIMHCGIRWREELVWVWVWVWLDGGRTGVDWCGLVEGDIAVRPPAGCDTQTGWRIHAIIMLPRVLRGAIIGIWVRFFLHGRSVAAEQHTGGGEYWYSDTALQCLWVARGAIGTACCRKYGGAQAHAAVVGRGCWTEQGCQRGAQSVVGRRSLI